MNELPVIGSLCLRKDLWHRQGRTLQVVRGKYMANGFFDVQKPIWSEINALSLQFYHKWIKVMLIRGKTKFL